MSDTQPFTYEYYNNRQLAVRGGDKKEHHNFFSGLGGRWNPRMRNGKGWLVPKERENIVKEYITNNQPLTNQPQMTNHHDGNAEEASDDDFEIDPLVRQLLNESSAPLLKPQTIPTSNSELRPSSLSLEDDNRMPSRSRDITSDTTSTVSRRSSSRQQPHNEKVFNAPSRPNSQRNVIDDTVSSISAVSRASQSLSMHKRHDTLFDEKSDRMSMYSKKRDCGNSAIDRQEISDNDSVFNSSDDEDAVESSKMQNKLMTRIIMLESRLSQVEESYTELHRKYQKIKKAIKTRKTRK